MQISLVKSAKTTLWSKSTLLPSSTVHGGFSQIRSPICFTKRSLVMCWPLFASVCTHTRTSMVGTDYHISKIDHCVSRTSVLYLTRPQRRCKNEWLLPPIVDLTSYFLLLPAKRFSTKQLVLLHDCCTCDIMMYILKDPTNLSPPLPFLTKLLAQIFLVTNKLLPSLATCIRPCV